MVNETFQITGAVVLAYLLGSIPSGLIIGKVFFKKDIRELGSRNIGATNIMRTFGVLPGLVVLVFDALKGFLSVNYIPGFMALALNTRNYSTGMLLTISIFCGLGAIAGHNWPVFLNFKGGKGVATSIGVAISLAPKEAGIAFLFFLTLVLITRYVSLGSILGAIAFLTAMVFLNEPLPLLFFGGLACIMIVVRHLPNIKRLRNGTENKLWQKK